MLLALCTVCWWRKRQRRWAPLQAVCAAAAMLDAEQWARCQRMLSCSVCISCVASLTVARDIAEGLCKMPDGNKAWAAPGLPRCAACAHFRVHPHSADVCAIVLLQRNGADAASCIHFAACVRSLAHSVQPCLTRGSHLTPSMSTTSISCNSSATCFRQANGRT